MTNAERYKEGLRALSNEDIQWAIEKETGEVTPCTEICCSDCALRCLYDCNKAKVKWLLSEYVEPIILTEIEYNILKYLADNTKHMYIARDRKGSLYLYDVEPCKSDTEDWWIGRGATQFVPFNKLFTFIKWEDEKPYPIKEILKHCEVKDCMIVR